MYPIILVEQEDPIHQDEIAFTPGDLTDKQNLLDDPSDRMIITASRYLKGQGFKLNFIYRSCMVKGKLIRPLLQNSGLATQPNTALRIGKVVQMIYKDAYSTKAAPSLKVSDADFLNNYFLSILVSRFLRDLASGTSG